MLVSGFCADLKAPPKDYAEVDWMTYEKRTGAQDWPPVRT